MYLATADTKNTGFAVVECEGQVYHSSLTAAEPPQKEGEKASSAKSSAVPKSEWVVR